MIKKIVGNREDVKVLEMTIEGLEFILLIKKMGGDYRGWMVTFIQKTTKGDDDMIHEIYNAIKSKLSNAKKKEVMAREIEKKAQGFKDRDMNKPKTPELIGTEAYPISASSLSSDCPKRLVEKLTVPSEIVASTTMELGNVTDIAFSLSMLGMTKDEMLPFFLLRFPDFVKEGTSGEKWDDLVYVKSVKGVDKEYSVEEIVDRSIAVYGLIKNHPEFGKLDPSMTQLRFTCESDSVHYSSTVDAVYRNDATKSLYVLEIKFSSLCNSEIIITYRKQMIMQRACVAAAYPEWEVGIAGICNIASLNFF